MDDTIHYLGVILDMNHLSLPAYELLDTRQYSVDDEKQPLCVRHGYIPDATLADILGWECVDTEDRQGSS